MKRRSLWWRRMRAALAPRRSLKIVQGDMLPEKLPHWNLVVGRLHRFLDYAGTSIGVILLRGFAADSLVGKS